MLLKKEGSAETRFIAGLTFAGSLTTSYPNTSARPESGSSKVLSTRTSVDLPEPLAPMIPYISPR